MPYGPVPNNYEYYMAQLIENKQLIIEEIPIGEEIREKLISDSGPDLSIFTKEEKDTLQEIKTIFAKYSSKKISDFSHQEEGYKHTPDWSLISYHFAKNLTLKG